MPREPAYDAKRSHDGEAPAASERAAGRMPDASGRRRGTGGPEPTSRAGPHRLRDCGFLKHTTRTAGQVRIAHALAASWSRTAAKRAAAAAGSVTTVTLPGSWPVAVRPSTSSRRSVALAVRRPPVTRSG